MSASRGAVAWLHLLTLVVGLLCTVDTQEASASEPSWIEAWLTGPGLTGAWFGMRETLTQRGITPTISYTADVLGNPVGGLRRGIAYAGQLNADLTFDLGKLAGLDGLTFNISGNWASGTNLSNDDIGNFFVVAQAFAGDRVRLYTLYLDQSLFEGRLDIKLGRFAPGDDFLSWPQYTFFVNIALNPAVFATQVNVPGFTAAPIATLGARVRARPVDSFPATAGIFHSDPARDLAGTSGIDFGVDVTGTGYLGMVELAYLHNQGEGAGGMSGTYRLGGYYDSNRFPTFRDPQTLRWGNWGVYVLADQIVYRDGGPESRRGLAVGGSVVIAPLQSINTIPFFVSAGVVYRGLLRSRPKDITGFAAYVGAFSRDLPGQNAETVLELTHTMPLTPWLTIQPDIQYVISPSGRSSTRNALVIGAQILIQF
jgi:porin